MGHKGFMVLAGLFLLAFTLDSGCPDFPGPREVVAGECQESLPGEHQSWSFDLNWDGVDDFEIGYYWAMTLRDPPTWKQLSVSLRPLGDNRVLKNDGPALYYGQRIGGDAEWSGQEMVLAAIEWREKCGWDRAWHGIWLDPPSPYIAVSIEREGEKHYGWLSIRVDAETSSVEVLDHYVGYMPQELAVIGRHHSARRK